ncbi:hypothetical protein NMY22_g15457 [Coprinellus aureogranulatus]|nr:hypothetical protein NMY22_g15457 [Coprinellus aureogranulatus]
MSTEDTDVLACAPYKSFRANIRLVVPRSLSSPSHPATETTRDLAYTLAWTSSRRPFPPCTSPGGRRPLTGHSPPRLPQRGYIVPSSLRASPSSACPFLLLTVFAKTRLPSLAPGGHWGSVTRAGCMD